jgi:periplasmic divalent cation tolerance protein
LPEESSFSIDTDGVMVYCTAEDAAQARAITSSLLHSRLIACANIFTPHTAMYEWQGSLCEESETAFIAKTTADCMPAVHDAIVALHTYECPCIVFWPLGGGHRPFLHWLRNQTH